MSGDSGPRRKGCRTEPKVRAMAQAAGLDCRRVPLSGAAAGWGGDIVLAGRTFEVKARASDFRQIYRWLADRHFGVIVAADCQEPLLVLRLGDFLQQCAFRDRAELARPKRPGGVSGGASGDGAA